MRLLIPLIFLFNSFAWGQELNNPNNLPRCDGNFNFKGFVYSGLNIPNWDNCWGKIIDQAQYIYEGEWHSGRPYGLGTYTPKHGNNKYIGEIIEINVHGISGRVKHISQNATVYVGEMKDGNRHGRGTFSLTGGQSYTGYWINDRPHGMGKLIFSDGREPEEGQFENGSFIKYKKVNLSDVLAVISKINNDLITSDNQQRSNESEIKNDDLKANSLSDIERESQQLAEDLRTLNYERRNRAQTSDRQHLNLQITNSQANTDGDLVINIQTNADTASLKINGEEQGGKQDGIYSISRVARAGQTTKFTITAKDIYGNTESKTINVTRQINTSTILKYPELNPALVKSQPNRDAVAIIIGIEDYKKLPRADYANDDARLFYDYAIRGLGIKPENIKLLVDSDADQSDIIKTFKNWLPPRVKSTTDIFVYYSGHGLPSADGQNLYLLPQQADRDLIEDTAISQSRINAAIQATKPKSVTIFIDSCYSGAGRTGQTLLSSARPISLKTNTQIFPSDFTVFTASTADQISSSSNDLKHGIFSYYLMKGMEGEADSNKDGKITNGEMQNYLIDNVVRQASLTNRVQQPQLIGNREQILVGR